MFNAFIRSRMKAWIAQVSREAQLLMFLSPPVLYLCFWALVQA